MSVLGAVRIPRRQGSLDFSRGAAATLAVVTVVALVALVVQLFTVRPDYLAAEDLDANRGEVVSAAEQFTVQVNTFDAKDIRRQMPRFAPEHYGRNLALLDGVAEVAREAGCTLAQLALAWLLQRGPHVIPIPGTTNVAHLAENLGASGVALTPAQVERLDALVNQRTVSGPRYAAATQAEIDTEEFPPA